MNELKTVGEYTLLEKWDDWEHFSKEKGCFEPPDHFPVFVRTEWSHMGDLNTYFLTKAEVDEMHRLFNPS